MEQIKLTTFLKEYIGDCMPEKEKECNTKAFKQLTKERYKLLLSIEKRLDQKGVEELNILNEVFSQIRFEAEEYMFEKGVRLGAKLIIEGLFDKKA